MFLVGRRENSKILAVCSKDGYLFFVGQVEFEEDFDWVLIFPHVR